MWIKSFEDNCILWNIQIFHKGLAAGYLGGMIGNLKPDAPEEFIPAVFLTEM